MKLKAGQQMAMEGLWFRFGNNGPKHTMGNHKFIQRHVEGRMDEIDLYDPTDECREAVRKILVFNYSDFPEKKQASFAEMDKEKT